MTPLRRYNTRLAATATGATLVGLAADHYLPHPLATVSLIAAIVTLATAPLIVPIDDDPEEGP